MSNGYVRDLVAGIKEKIALNPPDSLEMMRENTAKMAVTDPTMDAAFQALFA